MQPEPNNYLPEPFRGLSDEVLLERWPLEFRFRDDTFVKIWTRWSRARTAWREAWWGCPTGTPPFFTDDDCPDHPVAREFIEARRAYHTELERRRSAWRLNTSGVQVPEATTLALLAKGVLGLSPTSAVRRLARLREGSAR